MCPFFLHHLFNSNVCEECLKMGSSYACRCQFHQHFTYPFFVRTSFFYVHVTRKSFQNATFVRKIRRFKVDEIDHRWCRNDHFIGLTRHSTWQLLSGHVSCNIRPSREITTFFLTSSSLSPFFPLILNLQFFVVLKIFVIKSVNPNPPPGKGWQMLTSGHAKRIKLRVNQGRLSKKIKVTKLLFHSGLTNYLNNALKML